MFRLFAGRRCPKAKWGGAKRSGRRSPATRAAGVESPEFCLLIFSSASDGLMIL